MSFQPLEHVCLRPYNTLAIAAQARYFTQVASLPQLQSALRWALKKNHEVLLLGSGSNLVFGADFPGLVIKLEMQGMRVRDETDHHVYLRVQAGESWHAFVLWTLAQGWSGLENLSLIPGTVGAAPVQNIGAYGVEVKDVIEQVLVLDTQALQLQPLSAQACRFAYRDSLFKKNPGRWVILSVDFRLNKRPQLQLDYGALRAWLQEKGITEPSAQDVSNAVIAIRQSKLPDPALLANAGSFFKNPMISVGQAEQLYKQYPQMVQYPVADGQVKLAAGWLIEQAGWKGYRDGDAGVHEKQALVLVNYGQASGQDILRLSARIQADIIRRFGVRLEIEPSCVP